MSADKPRYDNEGVLKKQQYRRGLRRLQEELVKLRYWIKERDLRVCVVFEGRDAAGKGGVIERITHRLSPRVARVIALSKPTERKQGQWYFQRYVGQLPTEGETALFDRSWYDRAGVERVMGSCTDEEHEEFPRTYPEFGQVLIRSGVILVKY